MNERSEITRSGARRLGDEYQDLIALEVMVDWLEHPDRYVWIRLEADDAGYLDDVVALRTNETIVVKQIKFSTHPEQEHDPLTWERLLEKPQGKNGKGLDSLLQKWAASLDRLSGKWQVAEASVISNRKAAPDIKSVMTVNELVDFEKISDSTIRQTIIHQLGNDAKARVFFTRFHFHLDYPSLTTLEDALKRRFFRLGGTEQGWINLKDTIPIWVSYRNEPSPDGEITLNHIRKTALWYQLQSLPQHFEIPRDYVLPSNDFHDDLVHDLRNMRSGGYVLFASPGVGKSTYSSYLYHYLKDQNVPVIRHHYFLSSSDRSWSYRLDYTRAIESLMYDLFQEHEAALGDLASKNPRDAIHEFGKWIDACGRYYALKGKALIVMIDGLDHVWRSRQSIEDLDRLLNHLFPTPEGVLVFLATQPVDDTKLPQSLLRFVPRKDWKRLPLLDQNAVAQWLRHHVDDLKRPDVEDIPDHLVEQLSDALYRKSKGHPLLLRYMVRTLQEQAISITVSNIEQLPGCPHEDINSYYEELWRTLPEESRQLLHLLAACPFSWPRQGLFDCLRATGMTLIDVRCALNQVEHLLLQDELGLSPFHSSLLVYIENLAEHTDYKRHLQKYALEWIRHTAPDHWRWAYEWALEADLGNELPLRMGPNRQWGIEAIAARRSRYDIEDILVRSIRASLKAGDLVRAIEVGLINDYCYSAFEYQDDIVEQLLYPQFIISKDSSLLTRLSTSINELTDREVGLLAEIEADRGNTHIVEHCFLEMINRLRNYHSRPLRRSGSTWRDEVEPFLKIAAINKDTNLPSILDFAIRNRGNGYTREMLSIYSYYLRVRKDAERIREILKDTITTPTQLTNEPLSSNYLLLEEREAILHHAVMFALEEELDIHDGICNAASKGDPFVAIYCILRNVSSFDVGVITFPNKELLSLNRYEYYEHSHDMQEMFYRSFFCLLANHLYEQDYRNEVWLHDIDTLTWQGGFLHHLNTIAFETANMLRAGSALSFGWFYEQLSRYHRPVWPEEHTVSLYGYSNAASKAASRLAMDLLILNKAVNGNIVLTRSDLERALASSYFDLESWINSYITQRRPWMSDEAVTWFLQEQATQLRLSIEHFPDRAERFSILASVAALHNLEEAQNYVVQAANNLLAHGHHKDMLFEEILEVIHTVYTSNILESEAMPKLKTWLLRLAPAIAKIDEFTDSDETGHLPRKLAEVLADIAPNWLPIYYLWLCNREKYYDALYTFEVFLKKADLSNLFNNAVAQTAVEEQNLLILAERARSGESGARTALASVVALMGEAALGSKPQDQSRTSNQYTDYQAEPILVEEYSPDQFDEFLTALNQRRIIHREERIQEWITFWTQSGYKNGVFKGMEKAVQRGINIHTYDTMFNLALELYGKGSAYPWLIKAHSEELGWARYITYKDKAVRRWDIIKQHYSNKWLDFLQNSLLEKPSWLRFSLGHNTFVRIIEYCIFMNQPAIAQQLAQRMVEISLELISPLILPEPEWTLEVEKNE